MTALRNVLSRLEKEGAALGHFNVADLVLLKAVLGAAREISVPVLVGVSEGEREFFGTRQLAALVKSQREEFELPVFLNADHTHSLTKAMEAANAGFDAVWIDFSALSFEQNVARTKEAVEAIKAINSAILVEGEIGDIGTGSEIHETAQDEIRNLTTPDEARQFVHSTGIDVLAPAVGNMHGMLMSMVQGKLKKHLDVERIAQIKKAAAVFLTLHGGSGTDDEDFRQAIAAGINIIHINTELRVAWRRSLEDSLVKQRNEVVPYRILPPVVDSVKHIVSSRLRLFNPRRPSATVAGESATIHGVPTTQEQHHHLVIENAYVKVFEVEVGPHDATLMHYHPYDYIYIVFGDADLTDTVADKPEVKAKVPDLTVDYGAVQTHIVAMLDVTLNQTPRIFKRQRRAGRMHSALRDLCQRLRQDTG
jgi:fructose-bisphosphate aldolase, class II